MALTLDEAISLAERNNPAYRLSAVAEQRANAGVRASFGALVPSIRASVGGGYREGRSEIVAGQAQGAAASLLTSSGDVSAGGSWNRGTFATIRQQRASADAAEKDITAARVTLRANVTTQYLAVLQATARAAFQDTLLTSTEQQLALAQARQAVGATSMLDVRRAEVQVSQQRVARLRERNNVEIELARLFEIVAIAQPPGVRLTTVFDDVRYAGRLDSLLTMARQVNPSLQVTRARQRAADAGVSAARGAYLPTFSAQAQLAGNSLHPLVSVNEQLLGEQALMAGRQATCLEQDSIRRGAGLSGRNCSSLVVPVSKATELQTAADRWPFRLTRNPLTLSVGISVPLYDGLQRELRVQEASAARREAELRARETELRMISEVTVAYQNVVTAEETVQLQAESAIIARQALELAQERFRVGASSSVDVVLARSDYERAATDRINAQYEHHRAIASLERAVGRRLR